MDPGKLNRRVSPANGGEGHRGKRDLPETTNREHILQEDQGHNLQDPVRQHQAGGKRAESLREEGGQAQGGKRKKR